MTEKENSHQDWVDLRAGCTEQGTFNLIAETVERDVERFNKLPSKMRRNRTFKAERSERGIVYVAQVSQSGGWIAGRTGVNVEMNGATIRVWRHQECQFEIKQDWNEATLTCDLKVEEEILSVWQISQKAIGGLLFGYG